MKVVVTGTVIWARCLGRGDGRRVSLEQKIVPRSGRLSRPDSPASGRTPSSPSTCLDTDPRSPSSPSYSRATHALPPADLASSPSTYLANLAADALPPTNLDTDPRSPRSPSSPCHQLSAADRSVSCSPTRAIHMSMLAYHNYYLVLYQSPLNHMCSILAPLTQLS